jgi:hypothetical protein
MFNFITNAVGNALDITGSILTGEGVSAKRWSSAAAKASALNDLLGGLLKSFHYGLFWYRISRNGI